jgi:ABC-2 type transport system ATP-binding protein
MNNDSKIVEMRKISKRFGKSVALDNIDLDVFPGRIIGLLGANGSGKSTLLRHMIGLYLPDSGTCMTFGCDAAKLGPKELARIGYVHQEGELLDWMTVRQLIRYVAAYYPNWNKGLEAKYVTDFELPLKKRVGAISPGQRQRLAILLAIGFDPELLILDEPAAGLDPIARGQFLDLLLHLIQDEKRTIIISSHILSDVEKVIDHVLIMKEGHLLRDCSFDDLREEFCRVRLTEIEDALPDELPLTGVVDCERSGGQALLTLRQTELSEIEATGEKLRCDVDIEPLSLDEIYKIIVSQS